MISLIFFSSSCIKLENKQHLTQCKTEMSNILKKKNIYSRSVAIVTALLVAMASLFEEK